MFQDIDRTRVNYYPRKDDPTCFDNFKNGALPQIQNDIVGFCDWIRNDRMGYYMHGHHVKKYVEMFSVYIELKQQGKVDMYRIENKFNIVPCDTTMFIPSVEDIEDEPIPIKAPVLSASASSSSSSPSWISPKDVSLATSRVGKVHVMKPPPVSKIVPPPPQPPVATNQTVPSTAVVPKVRDIPSHPVGTPPPESRVAGEKETPPATKPPQSQCGGRDSVDNTHPPPLSSDADGNGPDDSDTPVHPAVEGIPKKGTALTGLKKKGSKPTAERSKSTKRSRTITHVSEDALGAFMMSNHPTCEINTLQRMDFDNVSAFARNITYIVLKKRKMSRRVDLAGLKKMYPNTPGLDFTKLVPLASKNTKRKCRTTKHPIHPPKMCDVCDVEVAHKRWDRHQTTKKHCKNVSNLLKKQGRGGQSNTTQ